MFKDQKPVRGDELARQLGDKSRARKQTLKTLAGIPTAAEGHQKRNDLLPILKITDRPVATLKPATRRLRKADAAQIARVRQSIETYGLVRPILTTAGNEIVDGHIIVQVAAQLGLTSIPCIAVDHLSPEDVRRLRISINRTSETGSWDVPELSIELSELAIKLGDTFSIPGLDADIVDHLLLDTQKSVDTGSAGDAPSPKPEAVSQLGDIWKLGPHTLGCGSARDFQFMQDVIPAEARVSLCLTDPPYGVPIQGHVTSGAHRDFVEGGAGTSKEELYDLLRDFFVGIHRLLRDGGLCLSFIDWRGIGTMLAAGEEAGFELLNVIVWAKTNGGMGSLWRSQHELCPVFKKGTASHVNNVSLGKNGRYRSNLWTYPGASSLGSESRAGLKLHPTVKPVSMLEDAILDVSERGDTVVDPFAGSGSTLVAAHNTGRLFSGVELDPLYADVILRRWIAITGIIPIEAKSGKAFQ